MFNNYLKHVFIKNNHWILFKIYDFILHLHCTIYDLKPPMIKKLPNDTLQLLTNILNIKHLLYEYVDIMQ
jgi:hypothetical protein